MHELGINKNTVVSWNNYMGEVYATDLLINPVIIRGSDTTVEVDESLFTGVVMGYAHLTANHMFDVADPVIEAHPQKVENSWKNAKRRNTN